MAFFNRTQNFFIFFILFGLWTSWQNSKYKLFPQFYSVFSVVLIILNFLLAIIFDRLHTFNSLSNIAANFWFILLTLAHLIIVLESIYHSNVQLKLIQGFSRVDRIFAMKLFVKIPYRNEKHQLFVLVFMMMCIEIITKLFFKTYYFINRKQLHKLFDVTLHSELMIALKLAQVLFFVYIIDARLGLINKKLIEFQNQIDVKITDKNLFTRNKNKLKLRAVFTVYEQLLNLKKIYRELCDICEQFEHSFGWSLLMVIVYIFINFTLNSYWVVMNLSIHQDSLLNWIALVRFLIILGVVAMYCSSCCHHVCNWI